MADTKSLSRLSRSLSTRYEFPMFKMCDRIGCHLNEKEVKLLTVLSGRVLESSVQRKIKNGKDLFLALSKQGYCDESNFYSIIEILKLLHRHDVLHMIPLRHKAKGNKYTNEIIIVILGIVSRTCIVRACEM